MQVQQQDKLKRVISIQPVSAAATQDARRKELEAEIARVIEQLPMLDDEAWRKIQFMLGQEGSLYHKAQAVKCKAILGLLGPARNTPEWTAEDDYRAYELYIATSREALDYLIRAESLLGHLEDHEYALFEDFELDKTAQLEIYLAWLKRRFAAAEASS